MYRGNATSNADFFWDFGGCIADSIDWNHRRVSLGAFNSNPVISLFVEENGCRGKTDTLHIGANPDFKMNTSKSRGCDSATIHFSGELKTEDALKFEWNFGDGSAIGNEQSPSHFYESTGFYNVGLLITNTLNGCSTGFTIGEMVKIFPTPVAEIEFDRDFCYDRQLEVFYPANIDSSVCIWSFSGAHQSSGANDSIVVYLDEQVATIRLQVEEFGCKSDWVEASAKRNPVFEVETDTNEGCDPLHVLASIVSADEQLIYRWLTDSVIADGEEHLFLLPGAGNFGFTVEAVSQLTSCIDTLHWPDMVLVHPKPLAQFEVDYPVAIIEHANLNFTNLTTGTEFFDWSFGDGGVSNEENPQHTYTAIGKYPVDFITESEYGCMDTATMEIEIVPFNVFTPNAFRPDSEIPENREFMPVGVGINPEVFQFRVYNRWGEMVFESENPEIKWDGTTKNSRPAPAGNYIWKADFEDIQGFSHTMKGQVLLIR